MKITPTTRLIETMYHFNRDLVKTNRASHPNRAVLHAINHMQLNTYGATSATVFDNATGHLHAVITRRIGSNKIVIEFKREVFEQYN